MCGIFFVIIVYNKIKKSSDQKQKLAISTDKNKNSKSNGFILHCNFFC